MHHGVTQKLEQDQFALSLSVHIRKRLIDCSLCWSVWKYRVDIFFRNLNVKFVRNLDKMHHDVFYPTHACDHWQSQLHQWKTSKTAYLIALVEGNNWVAIDSVRRRKVEGLRNQQRNWKAFVEESPSEVEGFAKPSIYGVRIDRVCNWY
jgi:hypothetical protein